MRPVLSGLRGSTNWAATARRLARDIERRPADALVIAADLDRDLARHGDDPAVRGMRHTVFWLVCCSPDPSATAVAVQLATLPDERQGRRSAYVRHRRAAELAARRPADEVRRVLDGGLVASEPEFGLLLLHELLLRGHALPTAASAYAAWAARDGHPLAALPLELLAVEERTAEALPRYSSTSDGFALAPLTTEPQSPLPLSSLLTGLGPAHTAPDDGLRDLFHDWVEASNGALRATAHHHAADFAANPDPQPTGATGAAVLGPTHVFGALFSAAIGGGAYSDGPGGAMSRLRTWRALATLLGQPWPVEIDELARAASSVRWIGLRPDDGWFEQVAWDLWLLVDNGTRVLAVAATDTD